MSEHEIKKTDHNFVWIDLEMTGLNSEQDVILEIATLITDDQLRVITEAPAFVIHQPDTLLAQMDEWNTSQHTASGLVTKVQQSKISLQAAEQQTLAVIQQHCTEKTAILAGNSVWQDRIFLQKYMPSIVTYLHYRIIDVSTIKELVLSWYPDHPDAAFEKKDTHRAHDDILESIAELAYYRKKFFL